MPHSTFPQITNTQVEKLTLRDIVPMRSATQFIIKPSSKVRQKLAIAFEHFFQVLSLEHSAINYIYNNVETKDVIIASSYTKIFLTLSQLYSILMF